MIKPLISFPLLLTLLVFSECISAEEEVDDGPYTSPGIVMEQGGKWVGSDHLLNLSNEISVVIELVGQNTSILPVTKEEIKSRVIKSLEGVDLTVDAESSQPKLPFLNMLIMVYAIPNGYTYVVEGRLFESVKLERVILDQQVEFQAITWERQSINVSSEKEFKTNFLASIDEITELFTGQYKFFELMKLRQKP